MVRVELTDREILVIRDALRAQYEMHKRNDFRGMWTEVDALRSKMSDAALDNARTGV
jgi:hypothetical protein